MYPGIAGRTKWEEWGPVGVGEVMHVAHSNRPVYSGRRSGAGECSSLTVEWCGIAAGLVTPGALCIWHEAEFIGSAPIVEAISVDCSVAQREGCSDLDFCEGIAGGGASEGKFKDLPSRDTIVRGIGDCPLGNSGYGGGQCGKDGGG